MDNVEKQLDEALSSEIADRIKSKARTPFDNAHKAALVTEGAVYVQGFMAIASRPQQPLEHGWIEVGDRIIDPTLARFKDPPKEVWYFPAQQLTVKQLKAAVEEAKEDYPDDPPLPVYGAMPYEYYGDVMLGGKEYVAAYEAASAKCKQLTKPIADRN